MNLKSEIVKNINFNCEGAEINLQDLIIESISADKGDYCLPCFSFAKVLKENPMIIANKIKDSVVTGGIIEKCEVVAGYVNFFLNKENVAKAILENFSMENFKSCEGQGKTVCIDYCSQNLAKYLHIGHLKTLVIGESLARLYEQYGYTVKRMNFIGDYGTPFGKMIGGMQRWGSLSEVEEKGVDALQDYYVKFNAAEAEDESLTQEARDIFKKIEDRDPEIYPIYEKIIDISIKDAEEKFEILGVKFDDFRGEMYYNDFVKGAVDVLNSKGLLKESQGAKIVDLDDYDMAPAIMIKNDGTTLYLTRDYAAVIDRFNEYKFDKLLYVTDVAQKLHFQQLIKVVELSGYGFYENMEHVPYGRFSLPNGKISSRRGKQAVLVDLLEFVQNKANEVIKNRTFEIENPDDVATKVARSVLNFNVLKVERIKDCVFDVEKAFSFEGETSPYMQYTYTRLESILRKYTETDAVADYSCFDESAFELVKNINDFNSLLRSSLNKRDISLVVKRVMEMCKMFNKFYTNCKVLDGNDCSTKAKINLVKALRDTLSVGFYICCIDTLKEM